ncbi:MAG: hypothetical protein ACTSVZ_09100 [Promethearchaeota archaeon]
MATAIVSSSISYSFRHTSKILIHVRVENAPAVKVYQKVGYRPKFEYVVYKIKL